MVPLVGWEPMSPRLMIFLAFSQDPLRNSGSPESLNWLMVCSRSSPEVEGVFHEEENEEPGNSEGGSLSTTRGSSSDC